MILSVILNGTLGFGMLIATLFCLGDINSVVHTPTGYPFMQIFYNATNSTGGATAMVGIIFFNFFRLASLANPNPPDMPLLHSRILLHRWDHHYGFSHGVGVCA